MGTFADRLRASMSASNMKAVELHELTGISKASISEYLSGNYEPKQRNIFKMAQALDVSPSYLMGVSDTPRNEVLLMKLGEWLKAYREEHGLSMRAMADLCGFSKAYINILEKGINPKTGKPISPTMQAFEKIAEATQIDTDSLLRILGGNQPITIPAASSQRPRKKGVRIPVLGSVAAGVPIEAVEDIIDYEEIDEELARTGEFFALQIRGASMEPVLYERDIVIVRKQSPVSTGDMAIVLINSDEATVKKIRREPSGIMLIGYNAAVYEPHFYTNEDIERLPVQILGKVVEMRRKF